MNKIKILSSVLLAVVIVILISGLVFFINGKKIKPLYPPITVTPTLVRVIPTSRPSAVPSIQEDAIIEEIPEFTGAGPDETTETERKQINQAFDLRSRLPVVESQFSIEYDYQEYVFVVSILGSFQQGKAAFETWRVNQGYGDIPAEKFVFKQM